MEPKSAIRDDLLAHAPWLRKFALSLCGSIDRAEDLVQDTFLQALTHLDSFQPGTHLAAWLVTSCATGFATNTGGGNARSMMATVIPQERSTPSLNSLGASS